MRKAFGTRDIGSAEPETKLAETPEPKNGVVKLLFGILASLGILLFAYNTFSDFNKAEDQPAAPAELIQTSAMTENMSTTLRLRGGGEIALAPRAPSQPEPVKTLPAKAKYAELDHYLKADHVDPKKSRLEKYSRTVTVLQECGRQYDRILADYQKNNQVTYDRLTGQKSTTKQNTGSQALTADNMRLNISVKQDNSSLGMMANADSFRKVTADKAFSRTLTRRECIYVGQITKAGRQNI